MFASRKPESFRHTLASHIPCRVHAIAPDFLHFLSHAEARPVCVCGRKVCLPRHGAAPTFPASLHPRAVSSVVEHYLDTAICYRGKVVLYLWRWFKKALEGYRNRAFFT